MHKITDIDLSNKKILMRLDLNVPVKNYQIVNDSRIRASLPTINHALSSAAAVIIMAHLGRPKEGVFDQQFSLRIVADHLAELLNHPVRFVADYLINPLNVNYGEVILLENVRFNQGEKANDLALAQKYADLCDVFVSDGFGVVHRAQASTVGVAQVAKQSGKLVCAGKLIAKEIGMLDKAINNPKKPLIAIVGGAKVSSKLLVLKNLIEKVDCLIVGGGIANTFLAASGFDVGNSLVEKDLLDDAKELLFIAKQKGVQIPLPIDVVVGQEFNENTLAISKNLSDLSAGDMILDIGEQTAKIYTDLINKAQTIIWNGPVGVFEFASFANGTKSLANAVANSEGFSFVGGGDTIAAVECFGVTDQIDYISTGGGSMLEYLEGKILPGLAILS